MPNYTFAVVMTCDQNEKTGAIQIDHISKKLENSVYFSDPFDLKTDSALKDAINQAREEVFGEFINHQNEDLPDGVKKYQISQPLLVSSMSFWKGHIVVPIEFYLKLNDSACMVPNEKNGYIDALLEATVEKIQILGPRMCNYPKPYSAWRECSFGGKRAFFRKIEQMKRQSRYRTPFGDKIQEALDKKSASGKT